MVPAGSFAYQEAISPLPNTLQAVELLLPREPKDLHSTLPAPRTLPSFPAGVLFSSPGMTLAMALTSETSDSLFIKKKIVIFKPSLFFPQ